MRLLLTRPEPESVALGRILEGRGHEVLVEPLLTIEMRPGAEIQDRAYQAVIVTSANGARGLNAHGAASLYKSVPVMAVGPATADMLQGFDVVDAGAHGVEELTTKIRNERSPDDGPLLYVRGKHVAGNLANDLVASGFDVDEVVLYEAVASNAFSAAVIDDFRQGLIDGVLLFSPRTAHIFCQLIAAAGLQDAVSGLSLYCLSQNVADACVFVDKPDMAIRVIAQFPTQESLINTI